MGDWQLIRRRGLVWPEKRVLVYGATDYDDWDTVKAVLHKCRPTTIVHGHAAGLDQLASLYAQMFRVDELRFPAQWRTHGIDAAAIRNEQMIDHGNPDLMLVFPGGSLREELMRRGRKAAIRVIEINSSDRVETSAAESPDKLRAQVCQR